MANYLLSVTAAVFYSVASARLFVALRLAGETEPSAQHGALGSTLPGSKMGVTSGPSAGRARQTTLGLAALALVLHAWVALSQSGWPDSLSLPFFTALAVTATGVVLLHLILCLREPADYLGLAVYPIAAVLLLASLTASGGRVIEGHAIQIHVLLSVLAYSVLSLAAAQAVLMAIQRHLLNRHRPTGPLRALPPLETTERLLFVLLGAGFLLLTLSLGSGFFFLEDMFAQSLVHKTVLSCAGWLTFGLLLYGRLRFGWRGRRAVRMTLIGFGVLILAYFGSKLVFELILGRG